MNVFAAKDTLESTMFVANVQTIKDTTEFSEDVSLFVFKTRF